jgi:uncharacterized protein (TIGR00375 family)
MEIISDLHLHSRYSRAVSQQMVIPEIAQWAKKKGIDLVATADWTHPLWLRELKSNLQEAGEGIYCHKDGPQDVSFLLSTEISSIYSQGGKPHRIHNLVFAPSFEAVEKINTSLRNRGANLLSDGRPIIGLSARDLAQLVYEADKNCLVISAHAWTPWYSLYGSLSGFDSLRECYGDMEKYIRGIETGLSSDPAMNWRIPELDTRAIISFSDAHSPRNLGREATVFEVPDKKHLSYEDIRQAIVNNKVSYTIEFYPEEGKYHYTGHRNCGVKMSPEETKKLGTICPTCGRRLTIGVLDRVQQLSQRTLAQEELEITKDEFGVKKISYGQRAAYVMSVPLLEILAESLGAGVASQIVETEYDRLIASLGSEFGVLLKADVEDIAKIAGPKVAEGIKRVRAGEIIVDPGFDGVFGTVKIWPIESEAKPEEKQMSLF